MPASRTLDPSNIADRPKVVECEKRKAMILADLDAKFAYVRHQYEAQKKFRGSPNFINEGISVIDECLGVDEFPIEKRKQLSTHMLLELERRIAPELLESRSLGKATSERGYLLAARQFRRELKRPRGRPGDEPMAHAVGAYMALFIEKSGRPVTVTRANPSGQLRLVGKLGRAMMALLKHMEPQVAEVQIANIVYRLRRKYAGRPMCFEEFCPLYGKDVTFHR